MMIIEKKIFKTLKREEEVLNIFIIFFSAFFHLFAVFCSQYFFYQVFLQKNNTNIDKNSYKLINFLKELSSIKFGISFQLESFSYISTITSFCTIVWFFWNFLLFFNKEKWTKDGEEPEVFSLIDFFIGYLNLFIFLAFHSFGVFMTIPKSQFWNALLYFPFGRFFLLSEGKIREIFFYFIYQEIWHLISPLLVWIFIFRKYYGNTLCLLKKNKKKISKITLTFLFFYHSFIMIRPFIFGAKENIVLNPFKRDFAIHEKTFIYPYFYFLFGYTWTEIKNKVYLEPEEVNSRLFSPSGFVFFIFINAFIFYLYSLIPVLLLKIITLANYLFEKICNKINLDKRDYKIMNLENNI